MRMPRMFYWTALAVLMVVVIGFLSPHQITVSLYKLHLAMAGGVVGFFFDRTVAYYARPDMFLGDDGKPLPGCELAFASSQMRRAIVIVGWVIAVLLGA